jgi:hypothetical protein
MSTKSGNVDVRVRVELAGAEAGQEKPKLAAFAYSPGGKLLDQAAVDQGGVAKLSLPVGREASAVRVLVGPASEAPDFFELRRRGAHEEHLRIEAKAAELTLATTILPDVWRCWLLGACVVRGTLYKRVTTGGLSVAHPVCNATVDIFEVDPLFLVLPKLPDWVIDRIRDLIVKPWPPRLPEPPEPFELPMPATALAHRMDEPTVMALKEAASSSELRFLAQTGSRLQFEQALIDRAQLIRPILCYFYPQFVTMQKVATAQTNDCGHFQTLFFHGCNNPDTPDLYFKARQRLFGFFDVTIYEPTPIACHTHWNYKCGTEVSLFTSHPLAMTCSPCPGVDAGPNWVLFTAIGNTSLKAIFGGGAAGATAGNWGLVNGGSPWGGVLRPRLEFDNSLREDLGVTHYQLSFRRGTSGPFIPLTAPVSRHRAHVVVPGDPPVIEAYPLGPTYKVVGGETRALYEIPPATPPGGGQWVIANAVLDTENGEWDSTIHARGLSYDDDGNPVAGTVDESGLYQLKLDLCDSAGNFVDIGAKNIRYVVPDSADLSGTIQTVLASNIAQPGGGTLVQGDSLVLTLHVDNNHCWAGIGAPTTPSGSADPCCGVVPYAAGATVSMPYTAFHPHGFATHHFQLFRSATQILPTVSGVTGSFSITQTVADMMSLALPAACAGNPPCTTAAFAENLKVYALATDGWGSYLGYNAEDNRAFALSSP